MVLDFLSDALASEQLVFERGCPSAIVIDNESELTGGVLDEWASHRAVTLRFIDPGTSIQNSFIERSNGRFRDECLNEHWFLNLRDAR